MSNDDTKKLILARRAAFIAAAVAGIASCDPKPTYKDVCLQPAVGPDGNPGIQPYPPAASSDPNADAGAPVTPPPQVCLSPMPASKP